MNNCKLARSCKLRGIGTRIEGPCDPLGFNTFAPRATFICPQFVGQSSDPAVSNIMSTEILLVLQHVG
jgi:hypothetical protein